MDNQSIENFNSYQWFHHNLKPDEGREIVYMFRPRMELFVGVFHEAPDETEHAFVGGESGHADWPFVMFWMYND